MPARYTIDGEVLENFMPDEGKTMLLDIIFSSAALPDNDGFEFGLLLGNPPRDVTLGTLVGEVTAAGYTRQKIPVALGSYTSATMINSTAFIRSANPIVFTSSEDMLFNRIFCVNPAYPRLLSVSAPLVNPRLTQAASCTFEFYME